MRAINSIQKKLVTRNYNSEILSENVITIKSDKISSGKKFSGIVNLKDNHISIDVLESNYTGKYLKQKLFREIREIAPAFNNHQVNLVSIGPGSIITVESGPNPPTNRQFNRSDSFFDYETGIINCNGWSLGNDFQGILVSGPFNSPCEGGVNLRTYARYRLS